MLLRRSIRLQSFPSGGARYGLWGTGFRVVGLRMVVAFGGTVEGGFAVAGGDLFSIIIVSSITTWIATCRTPCRGLRISAGGVMPWTGWVEFRVVGLCVAFGGTSGHAASCIPDVLVSWKGWEDGEAGGVGYGVFRVVGLRMGAAFGGTLVGGTLFSIIIVLMTTWIAVRLG